MRHVSRTHSVARDLPFDRSNLDLQIQIKCVDTKSQLADILTKGRFTHDEWNHLLRLFNVFLQPCLAKLTTLKAMSKRQIQGGKQGGEDERVVAKNKTCAKFSLYDQQSISNSVELELISKLGESFSKLFNSGIHLVQGNLPRRNRIRITHQTLKCGTQILTRTPALGYQLRDRKRSPLVEVCSLALWQYCRAHAVPQGFCGNLIDVLKLLANQQED